MGAWIETDVMFSVLPYTFVAPRVGAWIETAYAQFKNIDNPSHPVWVRGLKLFTAMVNVIKLCRTPCGCVD